MAKRNIQKIAALFISAAIALSSAPGVVYADSADSGTFIGASDSDSGSSDSGNTDTGTGAWVQGTSSGSSSSDIAPDSLSDSASSSSSETGTQEITGITVHTASNLTYNGRQQKLLKSIDGTTSGDIVEYKVNDGEYSTDEPKAADAGEYKVTIRIRRSGYQDFTEEESVTIAKADMSVSSTPRTLDYNGTAQTLMDAPTVKSGPSGIRFWYSVNDGDPSTEIPKGTDAGSYRIHVTAEGDKNYNSYDAYVIANIRAVSISGLSAALYGGTYDGKEHNAVTSVKLADGTDILASDSGYAIRYIMDGKDYGTTMPKVKDAGTYSIQISVEKDPNYLKTDIAAENMTPAEIVIGKAKPELSWNKNIPDGSRVTGAGKTLDLHAVCTNPTASDDYSDITYTVSNDSRGDGADVSSLASIDGNGVLTLKKTGCNLLVTASGKGDANHEDADPITYGLTVAEEDAASLLRFASSTETFHIGTSDTAADQTAVKADDDNGSIQYSISGDVSAISAGISINSSTGVVSVTNENRLIYAAADAGGSLSFTVTAAKTAGTKTAGWDGWTGKTRTVYDAAEASYQLTLALNSSLTESNITMEDPSGNTLTAPNGSNGWFNTEVTVKPDAGYQIARDDLVFSDSVSFGTDGADQGASLSYGVYLKDTSTGEVSGRIPLSILSKLDTIAPTGSLQVQADTTVFDRLYSLIRYWIFGTNSIRVTGSTADETSGVASAEYLVYHPEDGTAKGTFDGLTKTQLDTMTGWQPFDGSVSIDPDSSGFVYLKITDTAGNVTYANTSDGAVADHTAPDDISITLDSSPVRGTIYTDDVPFSVSVTDPANGDTYSGLKDVSWTVLSDGKETQSGTFDDGLERGARVQTQTGQATVEAKKNNSNNVVIRVTAEDWAGNTATKEQELSIDTTKPKVTLSYDNNSAQNGKYFKNDRTMTVTIKERNYEESDFSFPMTIDGNKIGKVSFEDIRNGKYGLAMVSDRNDSQSGTAERDLTDARMIVYRIGFGKAPDADHDYQVAIQGQDMAGNTANASFAPGSVAPSDFTVDKVAPMIRVTAVSGGGSIAPTTDAQNPAFTKKPVSVTERVVERNFAAKDASYQVTQKNAAGRDLSVYAPSEITNGNLWSGSDDTHTFSLNVFAEDANYSVAFEYTDLAGNEAVPYAAHYFTVDKTSPTGSLTTGAKGVMETFTSLLDRLRFRFADKSPITVNGSSSDETSGIASVRYLVYDPGVNARNTFPGLTVAELEAQSGWADWNGSIRISPDRQAFVYLHMEDRAGNVAFINTSDGVIADDTSPSNIQIELLGTPSSQNIYNGDVPFRITANDPEKGGTYSGLRHVTWEIRTNGRVTQSGNFDSQAGDVSARTQTIIGSGTVNASINNSNHVVLHVTTEDWAGNTAQAEKELAIDITKPQIEITYDRNDPANGKYYNSVRTATVRVTERNFDPSKVSLNITSTGAAPQISGWSVSPQKGESDSAVNTATITFSADADYTVTASCTDMAGNRSDYSRVDSFTVDRTAPEISVSYDNNSVSNGHYYNRSRTATITVKEHNFNAAAFTAAVQASYNGIGKTAPAVSAFTRSGDMNTAAVRFTDDGEYSFTLQDVDLAGNRASVYTQPEFSIDTVAPDLSFFDIKDHSANKDIVAPGVRSTDLNFDPSAVTLTLKGAKHQERAVQGTVSATANGESIKLADFAHDKEADDIYTLTARITDKAGNTTEKSVTFSVNRYGSNFTFDKETEELLDKYYLGQGSDLTVYETNVDQIVKSEIVVLKDGTSTTLKEGKDYTVKDESEKNGWHKYKYTIKKDCFTKEGLYEVQLRTSDKAGNIQDNKVKDSPIRFVVDHTAPTAVITGIEDNGRYKEISRTMHIQVTDNYAYGPVSLYIGDKKVKTFDTASVAKADGKLSYKVGSANGWQKIRVEYSDLAGNSGEPVSMRVLVTASTWQQALYSAWFIPTVIAVLCGLAFLIILLVLLKRRKEKQDQKA